MGKTFNDGGMMAKEKEDVVINGRACEVETSEVVGDDGTMEDHITFHAQNGKLYFNTGLTQDRYDMIFGKNKKPKQSKKSKHN